MKLAKACAQCRFAKRKCYSDDLRGPCLRCTERQSPCSLTQLTLTQSQPRLLAPSVGGIRSEESRESDILDLLDGKAEELVENYIHKIHDRPHSLFHVPTLRADVRRGSVSKALLLGLCSMGCRFSSDAKVRSLEPDLTTECKRLIKADLESISLENIQACILAANLCAADTNPSSEALFFPITMSQIMRLDSTEPADNTVVREVKRRVWWTLFMADRWHSSGLGLPFQIKTFPGQTDLPMDESIFHRLPADQDGFLDVPWKPGLWAHMITLVKIFAPIQDLNYRIVKEDLDDITAERCTMDLAHQLHVWEEILPADAQSNEENLREHQRKGTGGPFVALHLGFHHYSTLLFFQYLDTRRSPTAATRSYAERCKYHASSYSALLKSARSMENCDAVYLTVGHMAIVSSSVLVHTLLFGGEDEVPDARNSLNANFEALLELEQLWPALKFMVCGDYFKHSFGEHTANFLHTRLTGLSNSKTHAFCLPINTLIGWIDGWFGI
ncbi:hypothetical protein FQN50_001271 [Emmonsiellopsis sp. PD_5]|nr:hypothetical protein FQN50_001271 [Emmonsiellopsis sp. PD_5]